jgi:spore maturation protein CgeB
MDIVILGLSITSSWGNGHATTYRALIRALDRLGVRVHFLERDVPWYAANRDLPAPDFCRTSLYPSVEALRDVHAQAVREADLVIVGSYVPDGVEIGRWVIEEARGVRAFYDIDTPVTLAKLARGDYEYLHPSLISRYDLYLSFTGGPTLTHVERAYGSPCARALYCSVDPEHYFARDDVQARWDLGYLGTHSLDRQVRVESLLCEPARSLPERRFVVAGPQYPSDLDWPDNVDRIEHLPPPEHNEFYNAQRFTLNVTRDDMIRAGYSPSVRLFEAAACGLPIISDVWPGIETFLTPNEEILLVRSGAEVREILSGMSEPQRLAIGQRARKRVLREHSAQRRAHELIELFEQCREAAASKESTR